MTILYPVQTTTPNGLVDKFTGATDIGVAHGNFNILTFYVRAAVNTFDPQVGGAAASIIAGAAAGRMRVTGLSGMAVGMVGELLRLSGSASAANNSANNLLTNGQGFWIAAFVDATTVDVINASAVVPDAGPLTWSYGCANGNDSTADGSADAPFATIRPAGNFAAGKRLIENNSYLIIDASGSGKSATAGEWNLPPWVNGTVAIAHPAPPSPAFTALGGVTLYAKPTSQDTIALADIAAIVNGALTSGATIIPITGTTTGYQVPPATTVAVDPGTAGNFVEVASTVGFDDVGALYVESVATATTIAAGSNGQALPFATIFAATTTGFSPSGIILVTTGAGPQLVSYTSVTGGGTPSFNGCSGGTGTMSTGGAITQSVYEQMDYSHKDATKFYGVTRNQRGGVLAIHAAGKAVYQPRCLRIGSEIIDYLVLSATDFGSAAAPCKRGSRSTTAAAALASAPIYQTDFAHQMLTVVTNKSFLSLSGAMASLVTGAPAGKMRVTGVSGMTASMIGSPLDLYGAADADANRHFLITDVISATEVYVQLRGDAVTLPDANNGAISWVAQQHKSKLIFGAAGGQTRTIESNTDKALGTTFTGGPPTLPFAVLVPSAEYNRNDNAGRTFAINMNTATLNFNPIGIDFTHDFAAGGSNFSFEVTVAGGVNPTACRFDMAFNNVRSMFTFTTGCVLRRQLRCAGSLQGGNNNGIHYYDAVIAQGAALAPYNQAGIIYERCTAAGSGGDPNFARGTGNFIINNFWIRKGKSDGLSVQVPMILTGTNGRIDECVGAGLKTISGGVVILTNVRTSVKNTRYGVEGAEGGCQIQANADCATLTGALSASATDGGGGGDMKSGVRPVARWWDFFSATRANSNVTKQEYDIPAMFRQPLLRTFTGLPPTASFDLTLIDGVGEIVGATNPNRVALMNGSTLRVTAVVTAVAGTRILSDDGDTASSSVALISPSGKLVTFEGTVTGFVISYTPVAGANTGTRIWAA